MKKIYKESIHQEFGRFIRDEMDDKEKEIYIKSQRYKKSVSLISKIFKLTSCVHSSTQTSIAFVVAIPCTSLNRCSDIEKDEGILLKNITKTIRVLIFTIKNKNGHFNTF